jgi:tetraacyldisaccharide 4'-kinase
MRAPGFWSDPIIGWPARLLSPLGAIQGALTAWRMARPGRDAGVPVVCVGNFVAGGAGKTPTAQAIALMLRDMGRSPAILTRGYGGRLPGPLRVDPAGHGAADVGDEPLLLARTACEPPLPVIVARDRPAGAALAVMAGADCIVMDDGLQNPSLAKTLSLAVVDGAAGIGNGLCLPAGPLRAPLARQLRQVDAVIVIGASGPGADHVAASARAAGVKVLGARLAPDDATLEACAGKRLLAFAGIGRPAKFEDTLIRAGAEVAALRAFPDHHPYTSADVARLLAEADAAALTLATTEKDWVKLEPLWPKPRRDRIIVIRIALVFDAPADIQALLAGTLEA